MSSAVVAQQLYRSEYYVYAGGRQFDPGLVHFPFSLLAMDGFLSPCQ